MSYGPIAIPQPSSSPDTFAGKLQRLTILTERARDLRDAMMVSIRGQMPQSAAAPVPKAVPNGLLEGYDTALDELETHLSALLEIRNAID